jgi:hypothetical protein
MARAHEAELISCGTDHRRAARSSGSPASSQRQRRVRLPSQLGCKPRRFARRDTCFRRCFALRRRHEIPQTISRVKLSATSRGCEPTCPFCSDQSRREDQVQSRRLFPTKSANVLCAQTFGPKLPGKENKDVARQGLQRPVAPLQSARALVRQNLEAWARSKR